MRLEPLLVLAILAYVGSVVLWGWFMSMIAVLHPDMLTFFFKTHRWEKWLVGCVILLLAPLCLGLLLVAYVLLIIAEKTGLIKWLVDRGDAS